MERNSKIDSVRVLCNLLVVSFHAFPFMYFDHRGLSQYLMEFLVYYLGNIFLPTLFLMSGWLMFRNFTIGMYGRKLLSRVRHFVVPYILWNCLYVLMFWVAGRFNGRAQGRFLEQNIHNVLDFVIVVLPNFSSTEPDTSLWFLAALLWLALASPVFLLVYRVNSWCVIFGGCAILLGFIWFFPQFFDLYRYRPYTIVCYVIGGFMGYRQMDICCFFGERKCLFGILGIASISVIYVMRFFGVETHDCSSGVRDVAMVLAAPLLMAFSAEIDRVFKRMNFDKLVQPAAFFIYCGHVFFVSVCVHLLGGLGFAPWVVWAASFVCVTVFLVAMWHALHRHCSGVLKFFDGSF